MLGVSVCAESPGPTGARSTLLPFLQREPPTLSSQTFGAEIASRQSHPCVPLPAPTPQAHVPSPPGPYRPL